MTHVLIRETLLRGCLAPSAIPLKFTNYLVRPKLPEVPGVFGHWGQQNFAWGMLGNNRVGNCTLAEAAHDEMLWHMAGYKTAPIFTDELIIRQYLGLTGGRDVGLDPIKVAKWRVSTGLHDDAGVYHKLKAFAAVDNIQDQLLATYLFGASGFFLNLPASAETQFAKGQVWNDLSGKAVGGHAVSLIGRNSRGNLVCITWGRLQAMTMAYAEKWTYGVGLAYFNLDYLRASGLSPEGFNESQLDADLEAL